jgi:hypothetical protein
MTGERRLDDVCSVQTIDAATRQRLPIQQRRVTHLVLNTPFCSRIESPWRVHKYPISLKSSSFTSSEIFSQFMPLHLAWKSKSLYMTSGRASSFTRSRYPLVTIPSFPVCSDRFTMVYHQLPSANGHQLTVGPYRLVISVK